MKMPLLVTLGTLLLVLGAASAETEKPSLPPGPLVVTTMPDFARWTVEYSYEKDSGTGNTPSTPQAGVPDGNAKSLNLGAIRGDMQLLRVVYTKTGKIRHEEWTYDNGKKEVWYMNGLVVQRGPDTSVLVPSSEVGMEENAFPELGWLSKETFTGSQTKDGKQLLVFKKNWYDDERSFLGTSSACIDPATHYPVSLQFQNQTRHYTILPPPTEPLIAPAEFTAAADAMTKQINQAIPHLSPP